MSGGEMQYFYHPEDDDKPDWPCETIRLPCGAIGIVNHDNMCVDCTTCFTVAGSVGCPCTPRAKTKEPAHDRP